MVLLSSSRQCQIEKFTQAQDSFCVLYWAILPSQNQTRSSRNYQGTPQDHRNSWARRHGTLHLKFRGTFNWRRKYILERFWQYNWGPCFFQAQGNTSFIQLRIDMEIGSLRRNLRRAFMSILLNWTNSIKISVDPLADIWTRCSSYLRINLWSERFTVHMMRAWTSTKFYGK